jgi:hypothetical protein
MRNALIGAAVVLALALAVGSAVIGTAMYNVAAGQEHSALVYSLLETARACSIAAHVHRDRSALTHRASRCRHDPEHDRSGRGERDRCSYRHDSSGPMTGWRFVRQDFDSRQKLVTLAANQLQIAQIVRIVRERIS